MRMVCRRKSGRRWMRPTTVEEAWVASNAWRCSHKHNLQLKKKNHRNKRTFRTLVPHVLVLRCDGGRKAPLRRELSWTNLKMPLWRCQSRNSNLTSQNHENPPDLPRRRGGGTHPLRLVTKKTTDKCSSFLNTNQGKYLSIAFCHAQNNITNAEQLDLFFMNIAYFSNLYKLAEKPIPEELPGVSDGKRVVPPDELFQPTCGPHKLFHLSNKYWDFGPNSHLNLNVADFGRSYLWIPQNY